MNILCSIVADDVQSFVENGYIVLKIQGIIYMRVREELFSLLARTYVDLTQREFVDRRAEREYKRLILRYRSRYGMIGNGK